MIKRPPHPATVNRATNTPHPATRIQAKSVFPDASRSYPTHAALVQRKAASSVMFPFGRSAIIQRAGPNTETSRGKIHKLVGLSTALLAIGKASDSSLQEVQAMYYGDDDDTLALKISTNPNEMPYLLAGLGEFRARRRAYRLAIEADAQYNVPRWAEVVTQYTMDDVRDVFTDGSFNTVDNDKFITGAYHAEQNLVNWVAASDRLANKTRLYIAGSKLPCSKCLPVLTQFETRLGVRRPNVLFYFRDTQGQVVGDDVGQLDVGALNP